MSNGVSQMDVDELEAGPELDRLVVERVMGWERRNEVVEWYYPQNEDYPIGVGPEEEFSPSTCIAAAWEVMEHLRQEYDCSVTAGLMGERHQIGPIKATRCTIMGGDLEYDNWDVKLVVYAETPELAICRAALKAVLTQERGKDE